LVFRKQYDYRLFSNELRKLSSNEFIVIQIDFLSDYINHIIKKQILLKLFLDLSSILAKLLKKLFSKQNFTKRKKGRR
jgi:hypothetical protein